MSDLPAIIGALGLLIGTVFGGIAALDRRRDRLNGDASAELEDYQRWHPRIVRALTLCRAVIAATDGATEPDAVAELAKWPPPAPPPKHSRVEVSADDPR